MLLLVMNWSSKSGLYSGSAVRDQISMKQLTERLISCYGPVKLARVAREFVYELNSSYLCRREPPALARCEASLRSIYDAVYGWRRFQHRYRTAGILFDLCRQPAVPFRRIAEKATRRAKRRSTRDKRS